MELSLSQIKNIALGAARIKANESGIDFFRFTEQQEQLYKHRSDDFYAKTLCSSGIKLFFYTNSEKLFFKVLVSHASSRSYFSFDLFVNGRKLDSLTNFIDTELPIDYTKVQFPLGEFSKEFILGPGKKEVCIHFPWSVKSTLKELVLDDNAFLKPIKPRYKLLCFGDSITQGYDALYTSSKYTSQLAGVLDCEEYNKAIGGEIFFPELAAAKEKFVPDYITVAYGTNDWNRCTRDEFTHNCKEFFYNLNISYPNSKIFAVTPIWRKELHEYRQFGEFKGIGEIIKNTAGQYENITVIDGFEFVPQNESCFADLRLHPNDMGFSYYFKNLANHIK